MCKREKKSEMENMMLRMAGDGGGEWVGGARGTGLLFSFFFFLFFPSRGSEVMVRLNSKQPECHLRDKGG